MAEETKKTEMPAPEEKEGEILSHKRRTALVAYLAVLFAVAFLLVAVSMVVENHRLQDSNSQKTATLNGKIEDLQDEYNELQKRAREQETQIDALQENLKSAQITIDEQTTSITQLNADLEAARAESETLTENVTELTKNNKKLTRDMELLQKERTELERRTKKTDEVYELLFQAMEANAAGRMQELAELLEKIEPNRNLFSPSAAEIYESLVID